MSEQKERGKKLTSNTKTKFIYTTAGKIDIEEYKKSPGSYKDQVAALEAAREKKKRTVK